MSIKGSNRSRLRHIEKTMRDKSLEDQLIVIEDIDHPGVFRGTGRDGVNKVWSDEELEAYPGQVTKVIFRRAGHDNEEQG